MENRRDGARLGPESLMDKLDEDRLLWLPQFQALLKPRVPQGSHGPRGKTAPCGYLRSCPRGPPGGPKGLQQEEAGGSNDTWAEEGHEHRRELRSPTQRKQ